MFKIQFFKLARQCFNKRVEEMGSRWLLLAGPPFKKKIINPIVASSAPVSEKGRPAPCCFVVEFLTSACNATSALHWARLQWKGLSRCLFRLKRIKCAHTVKCFQMIFWSLLVNNIIQVTLEGLILMSQFFSKFITASVRNNFVRRCQTSHSC